MTEREEDSDTRKERCAEVVQRITKRYGWTLIDREVYVERIMAYLSAGETNELWKAAMNIYCRQLYRSCHGDEGSERQDRGFTELHNYLYAISFRIVYDLPIDLRQELINEALLRIWERFETYYEPGAFLAIAVNELRSAIRPAWKNLLTTQPIDLLSETLSGSEDNPAALFLHKELQQRVANCFEQARRDHPRARQQLEAVWFKYIEGFEDQAISNYLGKKVSSIYVLRTRGLHLLSMKPCWQEIARDLHITDEDTQ